MTGPAVTTPATSARTTPRRSHPRTEYWDHLSASWRTRGPVVPVPRSGS